MRDLRSYGEAGYELFHDILTSAFLTDPLLPILDLKRADVCEGIQPLQAPEFLEQVLLPELACMLIHDDLGGVDHATVDEARRVLAESRKFGIAMYPADTSAAAQSTRRASGGWIGASPKRRRALDDAEAPRPGGALVQQTLPVRRSVRSASGTVSYVDDSSSDSDEAAAAPPAPKKSVPTFHQQRLHVVPVARGARPAPRRAT